MNDGTPLNQPRKSHTIINEVTGKLEGSAVCMWGPECKGKPDPKGADLSARCLCAAHAEKFRAAMRSVANGAVQSSLKRQRGA
jgi:hypothetical protein